MLSLVVNLLIIWFGNSGSIGFNGCLSCRFDVRYSCSSGQGADRSAASGWWEASSRLSLKGIFLPLHWQND